MKVKKNQVINQNQEDTESLMLQDLVKRDSQMNYSIQERGDSMASEDDPDKDMSRSLIQSHNQSSKKAMFSKMTTKQVDVNIPTGQSVPDMNE